VGGERWSDHRDERLFAQLYVPLRRFAAVVKPPEVDADDLVQEALVRALAIRRLCEYEDPAAYLRRTIVNLASNQWRWLGRRRRALGRLTPPSHEGAAYPSDLEELLRLKPLDRAALCLAVVEGRSYSEVADVLGSSEVAVRAWVSRALRRLRVELEQEVRDD
jgi:DNA-directed RNA polymerase specialized sigma24 family protein